MSALEIRAGLDADVFQRRYEHLRLAEEAEVLCTPFLSGQVSVEKEECLQPVRLRLDVPEGSQDDGGPVNIFVYCNTYGTLWRVQDLMKYCSPLAK